MQFVSSLLSSTILVLSYLTNQALCVPTDESSKLAVNNNQQPFYSTGNCTACLTATFKGLTSCSTSHNHCDTSHQYAHTVDARRIGSLRQLRCCKRSKRSIGEGPFYWAPILPRLRPEIHQCSLHWCIQHHSGYNSVLRPEVSLDNLGSIRQLDK